MAISADSPTQSGSPIVVGYDGRPQGRDALALGSSLARALDAPLIVAAVYPSEDVLSPLSPEQRRASAERLAKDGMGELAPGLDTRPYPVAGRSPAHGLHDLAEAEDAAALVVGSSHRGALGRVLAGNVATQLLSGSPCPVAVAPRGLAGGPAPLRALGVAFDASPESWTALQRAAALALASGGSVRIIHALEAAPRADWKSFGDGSDTPRAPRAPRAGQRAGRRERVARGASRGTHRCRRSGSGARDGGA